jgi:hypothetical protein
MTQRRPILTPGRITAPTPRNVPSPILNRTGLWIDARSDLNGVVHFPEWMRRINDRAVCRDANVIADGNPGGTYDVHSLLNLHVAADLNARWPRRVKNDCLNPRSLADEGSGAEMHELRPRQEQRLVQPRSSTYLREESPVIQVGFNSRHQCRNCIYLIRPRQFPEHHQVPPFQVSRFFMVSLKWRSGTLNSALTVICRFKYVSVESATVCHFSTSRWGCSPPDCFDSRFPVLLEESDVGPGMSGGAADELAEFLRELDHRLRNIVNTISTSSTQQYMSIWRPRDRSSISPSATHATMRKIKRADTLRIRFRMRWCFHGSAGSSISSSLAR